MLTIILLALCVGTASITISVMGVFRPMRRRLKKYSWLHQLVSCPYCTCHYVAFASVLVLRPQVTDYWVGFNLVISAFTIIALAYLYIATFLIVSGMEVE